MSEQKLPTTSVPFTELDPKEHRVTYMVRVKTVPSRTKKGKEKCQQQRDNEKKCSQSTQGTVCCFCGTPTCEQHDMLPTTRCFLHTQRFSSTGCCVCLSCFLLPKDVQIAVHTFYQQLNEQQ